MMKAMRSVMERLVREAQRKASLILDNLSAHHASATNAWLRRQRDHIEVFYQPAYSSELNPDELLNADLKSAVTKQAPKRKKRELREAVMIRLYRIASSVACVKSNFHCDPVRYVAETC